MISTSTFINLCLVVMCIIAFFLSLLVMQVLTQDSETTAWGRFGLVILTIILTPLLWVIGLGLIIAHFTREIIRTTENK